MPYQSASRPIRTPPTEVPSQASEVASDGAERTPPKSAAMVFRPTTVIHIAPNDIASRATERLATTQEVRVSMLGMLKPNPEGLLWLYGRAGRSRIREAGALT